MWTVPNIALLTECRLLTDSSAINMSLLRSEEQEETIRFHVRHSPALRDFLMESFGPIPACRPGPNLPEERNNGRCRARLTRTDLHSGGVKCL